MTALLIDAGNSRIKLALLKSGEVSSPRTARVDELTDEWLTNWIGDESVTAAYVSNVAGVKITDHLSSLLSSRISTLHFVTASRRHCGITNAYRTPEKLGSDRWVAMIGAHALREGALCVVSVGTAMTIDALDAKGTHLGGLIVPGPQLMVDSLFRGTSDIEQRTRDGHRDEGLLASDTLGAVMQGAELALASLIQQVHAGVHKQLNETVDVVVTGGAAARVTHLLDVNFREVPDLVLRGLAVIARQSMPS